MKNRFAILTLLIILPVIIFAGATLIKFDARSENGSVILNWQTAQESNVLHFVVERKSVNGSFMEIANVDPQSDQTYQYTDAAAFKSAESVYVYRLKIVDKDNSYAYSETVTVAHNVSSAYKRTWGSIKALFR